jgi:hypothetical protein
MQFTAPLFTGFHIFLTKNFPGISNAEFKSDSYYLVELADEYNIPAYPITWPACNH